jgi:protein-S-isoprenylcysteine O-methyltransferase Ste14
MPQPRAARPDMTTIFHWLIPALWLGWMLYWGVAAIGAKKTQQRESLKSRLSHIIPLILGVIALAVRGVLGPWLEQRLLAQTPFWFWLSAALVVGGLTFSVMARTCLGSNWSGVVTVKKDHELIRSGPYRWVRHPIYTGLLLALLGTALSIGNGRALVGLALIVVSALRKIEIEEHFLSDQFGDDYARYRAEVPALVPFVW